jgi:TadE-like protein
VSRLLSARRRRRGQGLVEFALVIPIFLLVLFGLIDVGRYVYLNSTLSQAAREGARLGSVEVSYRGSTDPACGAIGGPVCPANDTVLRADITAAANRMMSPFGSVGSVQISCVQKGTTPPTGSWVGTVCNFNAPGSIISVRVTASFTPITPLISQIFGTKSLSGSTSMDVN